MLLDCYLKTVVINIFKKPNSEVVDRLRRKEEGRRKKEEGRRKREEGRRKKEEGRSVINLYAD